MSYFLKKGTSIHKAYLVQKYTDISCKKIKADKKKVKHFIIPFLILFFFWIVFSLFCLQKENYKFHRNLS